MLRVDNRISVILVIPILVSAASLSHAGDSGSESGRATAQGLGELAAGVRVGDDLIFEGVEIDGLPQRATFELERFRVFADDATVVIHGVEGDIVETAPDNRYFRGTISGQPGSRVLLTVFPNGDSRGVITQGNRFWVMGQGPAANAPGDRLTVKEADPEVDLGFDSQTFECGADQLEIPAEMLAQTLGVKAQSEPAVTAATAAVSYTARVAFETDYQYYQKFGSTTDATNYIGDLVAYASTIYSDEVDTSLVVESVSLWTTSSDPWNQQADSRCQMYQFGRYWNHNRTGIDRTIAFMLSGYNNNSGIAWVGVLCMGAFDPSAWGQGPAAVGCGALTPESDLWGGGYGYMGGVDGNFDINSPSVLWDIVGLAHEIGHNFNSPHTHCYGGIGGNPNPVDECHDFECGQSGCHCGARSLPGCSPGGGCGTIMSYCHLMPNWMSNLSMTFGKDHPWGIQPDRVPNWMNAHVVASATAVPGCLDYVSTLEEIFTDDFESGDSTEWTSALGS